VTSLLLLLCICEEAVGTAVRGTCKPKGRVPRCTLAAWPSWGGAPCGISTSLEAVVGGVPLAGLTGGVDPDTLCCLPSGNASGCAMVGGVRGCFFVWRLPKTTPTAVPTTVGQLSRLQAARQPATRRTGTRAESTIATPEDLAVCSTYRSKSTSGPPLR